MASLLRFLNDAIVKISIPILLSVCLVLLIKEMDFGDYLQLFLTFAVFISFYPVITYYISFDKRQKTLVKENISKTINFLKRINK